MQFFNTDQIPTDLAEKSFAMNIARIMPNGTAPLFAMSGLAKKKTALQIEHGYWTKTMEFTTVAVSGAILAATTTIDVASTAGLIPNHILRVTKAFSGSTFVAPELMRVISITDGTTFVAERGFAGTTARDLVDAEELPAVGNAFPEGSPKPVARSIVPVRVLNNTQIFRNAWAQSGTIAAVRMIVGNGAVQENREDCAAFHATDIETATFFSRLSNTTDAATGQPIHTMDGIEALIEKLAPGNLKEAGATTNYTQLEELLDSVFDQKTDVMQGNRRTIFCGSTALKVINNIGRLSGEYQINDGQTNFGLAFSTFTTTRGKFDLVEHPIFNTNAVWKEMAVVMDLSSFDFAYLSGRDTMVQMINEGGKDTDGADSTGGVLTTELTIELVNPFACAIIYGLKSGVAEP
jgi:hypothetical protein